MIVCMAVYENHQLTAEAIASLAATVDTSVPFELVIVDNASPRPYNAADYRAPFPVRVIRNARNEGNFWPLRQVADASTDGIVATIHNDLIVYELGWNVRLEAAFAADPLLGMVGFAGSTVLDATGDRAHTLSNLRGTRGHISAEAAGTRTAGLHPSVAVDGLFMALRRTALGAITLDEHLPPAHFIDRIWSAQVIEAGWRLATLGVECDHVGWSTEVRLARQLEPEWRRWCDDEGLRAGTDPMAAIWNAGAGAWSTFRPRFWPCTIDAEWVVSR